MHLCYLKDISQINVNAFDNSNQMFSPSQLLKRALNLFETKNPEFRVPKLHISEIFQQEFQVEGQKKQLQYTLYHLIERTKSYLVYAELLSEQNLDDLRVQFTSSLVSSNLKEHKAWLVYVTFSQVYSNEDFCSFRYLKIIHKNMGANLYIKFLEG